MKIGELELSWSGFSYGSPRFPTCYVYWWNWLPKVVRTKVVWPPERAGEVKEYGSCRYWGYEYSPYDGPNHTFGFWWFNVSWRFPWSRWK